MNLGEQMFVSVPLDKSEQLEEYQRHKVNIVMMSTRFLGTRMNNYYTIDEMIAVNGRNLLPVMVVINRFFYEPEMDELKAQLIQLYEGGIQRILCSDLGVLDLIQSLDLPFYVVLQTDTTMTSLQDINTMLSSGCHEVIAARELSEPELLTMVDHVKGMLGISFFGFPLMSSSRKQHVLNYFKEVDLPVSFDYPIEAIEQTRKDPFLIFEDDHGNAVFNGTVVSHLLNADAYRKANVVLYFDTLGLRTEDVLWCVRAVVDGMASSLILDEMASRGIAVSRGLLDDATVTGKVQS